MLDDTIVFLRNGKSSTGVGDYLIVLLQYCPSLIALASVILAHGSQIVGMSILMPWSNETSAFQRVQHNTFC